MEKMNTSRKPQKVPISQQDQAILCINSRPKRTKCSSIYRKTSTKCSSKALLKGANDSDTSNGLLCSRLPKASKKSLGRSKGHSNTRCPPHGSTWNQIKTETQSTTIVGVDQPSAGDAKSENGNTDAKHSILPDTYNGRSSKPDSNTDVTESAREEHEESAKSDSTIDVAKSTHVLGSTWVQELKYICPYCLHQARDGSLNQHLREKHSDLSKKTGSSFSYKCLYCEQWLSYPSEVWTHIRHGHSEHFLETGLLKTKTCDDGPSRSPMKLNSSVGHNLCQKTVSVLDTEKDIIFVCDDGIQPTSDADNKEEDVSDAKKSLLSILKSVYFDDHSQEPVSTGVENETLPSSVPSGRLLSQQKKRHKTTVGKTKSTSVQNVKKKEGPTTAQENNKCPYCTFMYGCPRFLGPHIKEAHSALLKVVDSKFSYKCLYCEQWCTRPRKVLEHMHRIHSEQFSRESLRKSNTYSCQEENCSLIFSSIQRLKKHVEHFHETICHIPKRKNKYDIKDLEKREAKIASGEVVVWGGSSKASKHKASTISTKNHTSSRVKDCKPSCWKTASERGIFTCGYCSRTFSQHCHCVLHESGHEIMVQRTKSRDNRCEECDQKFDNLLALSNHEVEFHGKRIDESRRCLQCGRTFMSPWYAKKHMELVHMDKPSFSCQICDKAFKHRAALLRHKAVTHGDPPSKPRKVRVCYICGAALKSREGFKSHLMKHSGIKPYSCSFCNRKFSCLPHRKLHENIHTGFKGYKCTVCKKSFTNPGSLHNHLYKYAVHGPLPKVFKFDDGSSQKAFDEAVKALGDTVVMKRASLNPRRRNRKCWQDSAPVNLGLDTLAQAAGMVNGLESCSQDNSVEEGSVGVDVPIQIVSIQDGQENTRINLPDGHQIVVIMTSTNGSLIQDETLLLNSDQDETEEVKYIQIDMNQGGDIVVAAEECMDSQGANETVTEIDNFWEVPVEGQSQKNEESVHVIMSGDITDVVKELCTETVPGNNLPAETEYVFMTDECEPMVETTR